MRRVVSRKEKTENVVMRKASAAGPQWPVEGLTRTRKENTFGGDVETDGLGSVRGGSSSTWRISMTWRSQDLRDVDSVGRGKGQE